MNRDYIALLAALSDYASSSFLVLSTSLKGGDIDATIQHSLRKAAEKVKDAAN